MKFNPDLIYGVFEMYEIESYKDEELTSERAKSGMFVFTRDNRLAVVSGANEWVMSYSGSFEIKDTNLLIHTESCNIREREGTTMTREILKLDNEWLILGAVNVEKRTNAKITWKRKVSL
jgi:hypothetical protein